MVSQTSPASQQKPRVRHLSRTILTLGTVLLLGVFVGLAAEIWLREIAAASETLTPIYTSMRETLALALGSLEAAAPLVAALVAVPLILARFLRHLYGTVGVREAQERLNRTIFGALGGTPQISVREGRVATGDDGLSRRLGGAASLTVYGDSAVVTERYGRLARILGTGVHTLRRHETIWETVDLRPQRWARRVFALTKEGIPIVCEVDVVFQIGSGREQLEETAARVGGDAALPPRCDEETVLRAATATWVRGRNGGAERKDWTDRVASMAESAARDALATYRLDSLIQAPESRRQHPRDEIHGRLRDALQDPVRAVGARLLDVKVGEVRVGIADPDGEAVQKVSETVSNIVSGQWIDAWQANWRARAQSGRAETGVEPLRLESARIEAETEMIVGLTEILKPLVGGAPSTEPDAVTMTLVEALDWMALDPRTRGRMSPEALRILTRLQNHLGRQLRGGDAAAEEDGPQVQQSDPD